MSVVTYHGITLPYADCTRFDQRAKYESSGTDWYCTEFDIGVQCTLNANYISQIAPDLAGVSANIRSAADIMDVIRSRLLEPRRTLSVKMNGAELIPQNISGGEVDSENGPQPQACRLIQLTDETFLMQFDIKASYWEKYTVQQGGPPFVSRQVGNDVLYNRWSETVDIDNRNYSTRTREGKFVIRSDNAGNKIADEIRNQMAVVGVPKGFLRQPSQYIVDPSGLGIQYRVVDKEQHKMPPPPAFEAAGVYVESAPQRGGAIRLGKASVTLRGDKLTDQAKLLEAAIKVAAAKIARRLQGAKGSILEDASASVDLYQNEVSFEMTVFYPVENKRFQGMDAFAGLDTSTPGSDGANWTPQMYPRGTAGLLLRAAQYYDPCLQNTKLNPDGLLSAGVEVGKAGTQQEAARVWN